MSKQLDFHDLLSARGQVLLFPASAKRAKARAAAAAIDALPLHKKKRAWDVAVSRALKDAMCAGEDAAVRYQCDFSKILNEEIRRLQVLDHLGRREEVQHEVSGENQQRPGR
ncbi:hypothetical protein ACWTU6_27440 [Mesorhizobium sp. BHbsci]